MDILKLTNINEVDKF